MNTPVSLLETTYSRSKVWVENGILKHTLDQTPSTIPVILPGAIHTSTSNTVQTIKVPYTLTVQFQNHSICGKSFLCGLL